LVSTGAFAEVLELEETGVRLEAWVVAVGLVDEVEVGAAGPAAFRARIARMVGGREESRGGHGRMVCSYKLVWQSTETREELNDL
jgi:hypothetical protein